MFLTAVTPDVKNGISEAEKTPDVKNSISEAEKTPEGRVLHFSFNKVQYISSCFYSQFVTL